jgi:hypothetical protein
LAPESFNVPAPLFLINTLPPPGPLESIMVLESSCTVVALPVSSPKVAPAIRPLLFTPVAMFFSMVPACAAVNSPGPPTCNSNSPAAPLTLILAGVQRVASLL